MSRFVPLAFAVVLSVGACGAEPGPQEPPPVAAGEAPAADEQAATDPIPLQVPINSVMAGIVNRSSFVVFQAATAGEALSEPEWLGVGAAAIDLVGAATLTTIPGTGENDAAWVAEPDWIRFSEDMRDASMAVGRAASQQDASQLSEASARLAQSCQSCHIVFSPRLVTSTTQ